jgi:hypothetical protein
VFTALAAQPKVNMLRLSTSTTMEGAKVTTLAATNSEVLPGDVIVSAILIPKGSAAASYIWVIERPAGAKAQAYADLHAQEDALESYDSIAKRDAAIPAADSTRETSHAVNSYVYQIAMYGRGHAPLLASSRITLTDLAAPILQQPNAALRLRTNPGRPSKKLPYREVFWPFKVDNDDKDKADSDVEIQNEEMMGDGNVSGLWDGSIGPLHTVRVTPTKRTRSSEDSNDSDSSGGNTRGETESFRANSASDEFRKTTSMTASDSEMSLSQTSQHSSLRSHKRKPLWLQIVTDGEQGQFCMKKYTQTISLAPLNLSLSIPVVPPILEPSEGAQEDDLVVACVLESEADEIPPDSSPVSAPVQTSPIVPSPLLKQDLLPCRRKSVRMPELDAQVSEAVPTPVLKTKPAASGLHTPDSQSIESFIMATAEREGGDISPGSSLSSGSVGGSQKYYVTSKVAWEVNAKNEEKDDDDLSQFLSRPNEAYSVARQSSLSELRTARDTDRNKAHPSSCVSTALSTLLMVLIVVLIAFVAIGIALLLTMSKPPSYDTKWLKARTTS